MSVPVLNLYIIYLSSIITKFDVVIESTKPRDADNKIDLLVNEKWIAIRLVPIDEDASTSVNQIGV